MRVVDFAPRSSGQDVGLPAATGNNRLQPRGFSPIAQNSELEPAPETCLLLEKGDAAKHESADFPYNGQSGGESQATQPGPFPIRSPVMSKKIIATTSAPTPVGPYSQAVVLDGWVWTSGQVALDPSTGKIVGDDAAAQAERTLQNITAILEAAGSDLAQVVRAAVYLTDMDDFAAVNAVYSRYFPSAFPARVCVEVSRLPLGALVEIDVTAKVAA